MGDNTPGFEWSGDVRTDYGEYGVPLNATASKWDRASAPDRMWVPAYQDPALTGAARVNYVGDVGLGAPPAEGFATARARFSYNPTLMARSQALDANLDAIGIGDDGPPGSSGGVHQADDTEAQAWAGQPPPPAPTCGAEGFASGRSPFTGGARGRERLEGDGDGDGDLFSDHNLLVLVFVLVLFMVVQSMIGAAVRDGIAAGLRERGVADLSGD